MKYIALIAVIFGLSVTAANAEDEFGSRFTSSAPPALQAGDESAAADDLTAPQDIEPAAGDEAVVDSPAVPMSTEIDNQADDASNEIETKL